MNEKKYIVHVQLISVDDQGKPINSEIMFTHTVSLEKRGLDDWWLRRITGSEEPPALYSGGETPVDAFGNHIAYQLLEGGLTDEGDVEHPIEKV